MIGQREDDHVEKALLLLTDAFKGKPVVEGLIRVLVKRAQLIEENLWVVLWGWVLEHIDPDDPSNVYNAAGQQLDDLGAIVGQLREGREDAAYIEAIRLRVRINRSKGRSEDMVQIVNLISELATYVEYYPLAWEVSLYEIENGGDLIRLLAQAKAASSYGVLLVSDFPEENVFKFDHAGDDAFLIGSVTTDTPDVRWPAALPTNPPYRRS